MALMVEAKGGNGGTQWDDGFDYEGVTEINVRGGREGIQYIRFDYVNKDGKITNGRIHGEVGAGFTQTFEIKHLENEYLLSVEGSYNKSTGVIQSIQFKTNKKTSDMMGCKKDGTEFSLIAPARIIIGFHGFADEKNLNSLGAYFIRDPSLKSAMEGGQTTCKGYDHGGDYNGIRKVYVTFDGTAIRHLRVDYDKAGQVKIHEHGVKIGTQHEFEVKYPSEYITSVEGSYAVTNPYGCIVLTSLTFKTSNGRTSPIFGTVTGTEFVLKSEGNVIVGFHGWVGGSCVESIGAYYAPFVPSPLLPVKLEAEGGEGGDSWDDLSFKNVKKIYIGQGQHGIASVKFEYENDSSDQVVVHEHGNPSVRGYEKPFELDPSEYITSVEAHHDKILGAETGVITLLRFTTNKRTSKALGLDTNTSFKLEKKGHKITGFHGKSSSGVLDKNTGKLGSGLLHKIGVHVIPITE